MDYLPRFLMSTRPPGDDIYEVLVLGEDSVGTLNRITTVLAEGNVNFVSAHGQVDETGRTFVNAFFCELSKAKVGARELERKLSALPFVKEVRMAPMKGLMHEGFMFPMSTIFAGRALVVGASAFSQIEGRLVEIFGSAGEVMAYEQGRAYATSTLGDMEEYRKRVGAAWDIQNIERWIAAQGWAVARVAENRDGFEVRLASIPAKGEKDRNGLSRFLVGMTVGMLEQAGGQRLTAEPSAYDPATDTYSFKVRKQKRPK